MIDTAHAPIDEWELASVNNELGADDVHVWRATANLFPIDCAMRRWK